MAAAFRWHLRADVAREALDHDLDQERARARADVPAARWPLLLIPGVLLVRMALNAIDGMLDAAEAKYAAAGEVSRAIAEEVVKQAREELAHAIWRDICKAAGVQGGMRRGGVLMLMPEAKLYERSAEREAEALHAVAMALLQYTPLVAQAEESTLLIDIGASLRLFGGIRALCRRIRANMRALGFTAALSCAPTARGAWLLARHGGARATKMTSLVRRLDRLPTALLPPARPFAPWFEGIGCFSLADMRRLPRPGLQRRCGRPLLDILDAAYGMTPELFDWLEAPTTFSAKLELFDRVENAEALLFGAHRLLLQMTGWLCAHQLAVERIVLQLEHERGRVACPPTAVDILTRILARDESLPGVMPGPMKIIGT